MCPRGTTSLCTWGSWSCGTVFLAHSAREVCHTYRDNSAIVEGGVLNLLLTPNWTGKGQPFVRCPAFDNRESNIDHVASFNVWVYRRIGVRYPIFVSVSQVVFRELCLILRQEQVPLVGEWVTSYIGSCCVVVPSMLEHLGMTPLHWVYTVFGALLTSAFPVFRAARALRTERKFWKWLTSSVVARAVYHRRWSPGKRYILITYFCDYLCLEWLGVVATYLLVSILCSAY